VLCIEEVPVKFLFRSKAAEEPNAKNTKAHTDQLKKHTK
jgi:hypothetical protein